MLRSLSRLTLGVSLACAVSTAACAASTSTTDAAEIIETDSGVADDTAKPRIAHDDDGGTGVDAAARTNVNADAGEESETDAGSAPDTAPPVEAGPAPKPPAPPPPQNACKTANQCSTASSAGSIAGDTGSESFSDQGATSKWIAFRVREDSRFGGSTKFTATLLSPPGTNYDLFVYMNTEADEVECAKESTSSTEAAGTSDKVSMSWGYAFYDDSRTVRVEVRHISGPCDATAPWTLFVEGDR